MESFGRLCVLALLFPVLVVGTCGNLLCADLTKAPPPAAMSVLNQEISEKGPAYSREIGDRYPGRYRLADSGWTSRREEDPGGGFSRVGGPHYDPHQGWRRVNELNTPARIEIRQDLRVESLRRGYWPSHRSEAQRPSRPGRPRLAEPQNWRTAK